MTKFCNIGGSEKGKLVAAAAAKNLTKCILELGGKCITIVDESANAKVAAMKICGGRTMNAGQICIAPDYVMVHESKKDDFVKHVLSVLKEILGDEPKKCPHYCRIINEFHTQRILNLLKDHGGEVIYGGDGDVSDKYV